MSTIEEEVKDKYARKERELKDPELRIKCWVESFKDPKFNIVKDKIEVDFLSHKEIAMPLLLETAKTKSESLRFWSIYFLLKLKDVRARNVFYVCLNDAWGATIINSAEGLFRLGEKEISKDRLLELFFDINTHRHTRQLAAKKLIELGFVGIIPEGTFLDLSTIPPNHHDEFKQLYDKLSSGTERPIGEV